MSTFNNLKTFVARICGAAPTDTTPAVIRRRTTTSADEVSLDPVAAACAAAHDENGSLAAIAAVLRWSQWPGTEPRYVLKAGTSVKQLQLGDGPVRLSVVGDKPNRRAMVYVRKGGSARPPKFINERELTDGAEFCRTVAIEALSMAEER